MTDLELIKLLWDGIYNLESGDTPDNEWWDKILPALYERGILDAPEIPH